MSAYLAYIIPEDKKAALLEYIKPAYPRTVADHVSIQFKRPEGDLPKADNIEVIGMADDGNGLQALVVTVDGQRTRPDGKPYHITWSLDPEKMAPAEFDINDKPEKRKSKIYRPAHSSRMISQFEQEGKIRYFERPISLGAVKSTFAEAPQENIAAPQPQKTPEPQPQARRPS